MKVKVAGVYNYHGDKKKGKKKKKSEKDILKMIRKRIKKNEDKFKKQARCTHVGKNDGKLHLRKVTINGNEYMKCDICKQLIIIDEDLLTIPALEDAVLQIYTVFNLLRHKVPMTQSYNQRITDALYMTKHAPALAELIKELDIKKYNKKKGKKSGKKKDKKKIKKLQRKEY